MAVKLTHEQKQFINNNRTMPIKAIAFELKVSKSCVYNYINKMPLKEKRYKVIPKNKVAAKRPAAEYSNVQYDDMINEILKRKV